MGQRSGSPAPGPAPAGRRRRGAGAAATQPAFNRISKGEVIVRHGDAIVVTTPDGQYRYVIYTPFATTESTGLPSKPHAKGMPWLMDPGTYSAHIMVGPFN